MDSKWYKNNVSGFIFTSNVKKITDVRKEITFFIRR